MEDALNKIIDGVGANIEQLKGYVPELVRQYATSVAVEHGVMAVAYLVAFVLCLVIAVTAARRLVKLTKYESMYARGEITMDECERELHSSLRDSNDDEARYVIAFIFSAIFCVIALIALVTDVSNIVATLAAPDIAFIDFVMSH